MIKYFQCQLLYETFYLKDADPNLSDNKGNTALHLAASIPSIDLCICLIDYHANVHAKNKVNYMSEYVLFVKSHKTH